MTDDMPEPTALVDPPEMSTDVEEWREFRDDLKKGSQDDYIRYHIRCAEERIAELEAEPTAMLIDPPGPLASIEEWRAFREDLEGDPVDDAVLEYRRITDEKIAELEAERDPK